jgi:hypothetical protein
MLRVDLVPWVEAASPHSLLSPPGAHIRCVSDSQGVHDNSTFALSEPSFSLPVTFTCLFILQLWLLTGVLDTCLVSSPKYPTRRDLREKGFILAYGLGVQSIIGRAQ